MRQGTFTLSGAPSTILDYIHLSILDYNVLSIFHYLGSPLSYCTLISNLMRNFIMHAYIFILYYMFWNVILILTGEVPCHQSRMWSPMALAADIADDSLRALMTAAPRVCTVWKNNNVFLSRHWWLNIKILCISVIMYRRGSNSDLIAYTSACIVNFALR